jgi:hypothetical protein
MADFDGQRFDYHDNAMVDENKPLSTLREHSARNQLANLDINRGNRVTYNRRRAAFDFGVFDNVRAYASYTRTCPFEFPYKVGAGMERLEVHLFANVDTANPSPGAGVVVGVWVTVELIGLGRTTQFINATGGYDAVSVVLELDTIPPRALSTKLRIWIRSTTTGLITSTLSFPAQIYPTEIAFDSVGFYPAPAGAAPSNNSYNEQVTKAGVSFVDHMVFISTDAMITYAQFNPNRTGSYERHWLSYIQIHGMHIEEYFVERAPTSRQLRPNVPTLGTTEVQFQTRADSIIRRPRLLSLGFTGKRVDPSSETWRYPHEEWLHTPQLLAPALQTLWTENIKLRDLPSKISVVMDVIPIHTLPDYAKPSFDSIREDASLVAWDVRAELHQHDAGVDTELAFGEVTVGMPHYPTDLTMTFPFLSQMHHRYYGAGTPQHEVLKEGQLFDEDFAFMQTVEVTIDTSTITEAQRDKPMYLALKTSQTAGAPLYGYNSAEQANTREHLVYVVVGMTAWAHH